MYLGLSGDRSMVPNLLEIPRSTMYNFYSGCLHAMKMNDDPLISAS